MERTILDLKLKAVRALVGRLNLSQNHEERKELVSEVFLELAKLPEGKSLIKKVGYSTDSNSAKKFAEDFLSLEIISEFLNDPDVEDIVIDGLKPIFLHSSRRGFIKTDKQFTNNRELELFIKKLIIFSGRTNIAAYPFGQGIIWEV